MLIYTTVTSTYRDKRQEYVLSIDLDPYRSMLYEYTRVML